MQGGKAGVSIAFAMLLTLEGKMRESWETNGLGKLFVHQERASTGTGNASAIYNLASRLTLSRVCLSNQEEPGLQERGDLSFWVLSRMPHCC